MNKKTYCLPQGPYYVETDGDGPTSNRDVYICAPNCEGRIATMHPSMGHGWRSMRPTAKLLAASWDMKVLLDDVQRLFEQGVVETSENPESFVSKLSDRIFDMLGRLND